MNQVLEKQTTTLEDLYEDFIEGYTQGNFVEGLCEWNGDDALMGPRSFAHSFKKKAEEISKIFQDRFIFKNKKFSQLEDLKLKNKNIKGVIFDLGYSLNQIKDPKKGLSFNSIGDLNMCMGINEFSAKDAINKLDILDLEKIFKFFGEEKEAKKIANQIIKERKINEIDTQGLVKLIEKVKRKKKYKIHCATKVLAEAVI